MTPLTIHGVPHRVRTDGWWLEDAAQLPSCQRVAPIQELPSRQFSLGFADQAEPYASQTPCPRPS